MKRRIQNTTGSGKKRFGVLITGSVVIGTVIILIGLLLVNSKKQLIERPYGTLKTLTIREAFENAFGTFTVQYTADGVKISASDKMNNRYVANITSSEIKISLNGQPYANSEEMYRLNIYGRALYNLLMLNAPMGYERFDPKSPISYLKDITYEHIQTNGKEYIKITGLSPEYEDLEIWYSILRNNENFVISVEKVILNKKELSQSEAKLVLAKIYKKNIEGDLVEIVQGSSLKEYNDVPLKDIFSRLKNARWTIKDVKEKIVELNALDVEDNNKIITIGFKLQEDGFSTVKYMYVDGQTVDNQTLSQYIDNLYKFFGFAPTLVIESEVNEYKEKILKSAVPSSSPVITFSEFFSNYIQQLNWTYDRTSEGLRYTVSGLTVSSLPIDITFLCSEGKVYLTEVKLNNEKAEVSKLSEVIASGPILQSTTAMEQKLIEIVKNSKLVSASNVLNNEKAFNTLLSNVQWTAESTRNTVTLTGTGKYGTKRWRFKFIFNVSDMDKIFLATGYMDNIQMIDEVLDYIIAKIFDVPSLTNGVVELVKNSILTEKTYSQILGKGEWSVDKNIDRVFFSNSRVKIFFSINPDGDVKPVQLIYNDKDFSVNIIDILQQLEKGRNISKVIEDLERKLIKVPSEEESQKNQNIQSTQSPQIDQKTKQTTIVTTTTNTSTTSVTNVDNSSKSQSNQMTEEVGKQDPSTRIEIVKKSKLIQSSKFLNNERAFNTFLYDANWTYDSQTRKVVLTGKGKYGLGFSDMKFVFDVNGQNEAILEGVYIDNKKAVSAVSEYILSKVFVTNDGTNMLIKHVQNKILTRRTYKDILGNEIWTFDRENERVVFLNADLRVSFVVEPTGNVKVIQLNFKGKDETSRALEFLKALESGMDVHETTSEIEQPQIGSF